MTDIILQRGAILNIYGKGAFLGIEPVLTAALEPLLAKANEMATDLENLVREVEETKTVSQSAIALLQGLKAALDEAISSGSMQAVKDAVAALDANQSELAAAISANTPAAPTA